MKIRTEIERQSPEPLEFYDASLVPGVHSTKSWQIGTVTTSVLFFLIEVLIWRWSSAVPHYVFMIGSERSSSPVPSCWQLRKSGDFLLQIFPALKHDHDQSRFCGGHREYPAVAVLPKTAMSRLSSVIPPSNAIGRSKYASRLSRSKTECPLVAAT
jgi:hypothetical protein